MIFDATIRNIVRRIPLPPIEAIFEPSKLCNLKCDYCRRNEAGSVSHSRKGGNHFTPEQFKEALDKLRHIRVANWIGDGEPLLNPDFNKLIEMSAKKGIRTTFGTNGTLVTKADVDFWKRHKVVEVSVSIDSPNPKRYEMMRKGAKFDRVIESCKLISEAGINLQVQIILFAETIEEILAYVDLAIRVGARRIALPRPHLYDNLERYLPSCPDPAVANPVLKIALNKMRKAKIHWYEPWFVTSYFKRCMFPFLSPYIQIGGTIQSCCFMAGNDRTAYYNGVAYKVSASSYEMGNILTDNFNKIWRGEPYKELRRLLNKSERPVGVTIESGELLDLKTNTNGRFSPCFGCSWRWSVEC